MAGGCYNCVYFGWKQPEDKNTIKQCAKCKMVEYCSWQCQREHWEKVHKQQCKYIAKLKIKHKSVHEEATCPDCKLEAETGRVDMCSPENPVLGCYVGKIDFGFGLPLPLGEMTGQFVTKAEATVSLMLRILLKLKDTKHAAWFINTKSSEEICNVLVQARVILWTHVYMLAYPSPWLDEGVARFLSIFFREINKKFMNTDKLLAAVKFKEENVYRPWDTLKLLASFLLLSSFEQVIRASECVGLPELSEDLLKTRVTSAQHSGVWQKILDTLQGMLVPYMDLVEVLCGGQLEQKCYGCLKETTVTDVWMVTGLGVCVQGPVLIFGIVSAVSCNSQECSEQCKDKIFQHFADLAELYAKTAGAACKCDYCGVWTAWNKGHRCSRCLTKVYCGEGCRDKDWVVHKLVCREGEEERKGGQQARKQEGKDRLREYYRETEES